MKREIFILLAFSIFLFAGCGTPESVKGSVYMANDGLEQAKVAMEDNQSNLVVPIVTGVQGLLKPVADYLGSPENPKAFDLESAKMLQFQAEQDVRFRKMLEEYQNKLLSKIPGADLFMTKADADGLKGLNWNELISALLCYLGASKGFNFVAGKVSNKKKK